MQKKTMTTKPKKKPAKKLTMAAAKKKPVKAQKKKVQAIRKGYNSITPYLIVNQAAAAIKFYQKAFGAKLVKCMDGPNKKVMHAELKIGDSKFMLADEFPEMNAHGPKKYNGSPITVHLYVKNVDAVVKQAVKLGAKLLRPVEDQFYGDRSGAFEDPYGHQWHVATHIEDVSNATIKKRAAELFGKKT